MHTLLLSDVFEIPQVSVLQLAWLVKLDFALEEACKLCVQRAIVDFIQCRIPKDELVRLLVTSVGRTRLKLFVLDALAMDTCRSFEAEQLASSVDAQLNADEMLGLIAPPPRAP